MPKFVITYYTGEYESYSEHIHTVNADAEQDILDELNRNLPAFVECNQRFRTIVNSRTSGNREWQKQYQEQIVEKDDYLKFSFPFFNQEISIHDPDGTTLSELFPDLRILPLEEWFVEHCVN